MGSFSDSIKKNVDKVLQEIDDTYCAVAYSLFTSVVYNSPTQPFAKHAKGEFINNWFVGVGDYNTSTTSSTSYDGMGSLSRIAELKNSKAFYGKDNFVTLSNSVSYVQQVEYLGWQPPRWSGRVGPYAPVRNTIASFKIEEVDVNTQRD